MTPLYEHTKKDKKDFIKENTREVLKFVRLSSSTHVDKHTPHMRLVHCWLFVVNEYRLQKHSSKNKVHLVFADHICARGCFKVTDLWFQYAVSKVIASSKRSLCFKLPSCVPYHQSLPLLCIGSIWFFPTDGCCVLT